MKNNRLMWFQCISQRIQTWLTNWLLYEEKRMSPPLQDFHKMSEALQLADVLLFKGRARISRVISIVTQSRWTHAALYIGRCSDYAEDSETLALIREHYTGDAAEQLVLESLLGQGTVITPLSMYERDSIRLCRPRGLLKEDAEKVVFHAVQQVGREYDIRQLFYLARFMYPYAVLPRRWKSSLFTYKAGSVTKTVCSTVLVEAFMVVKFPVIPVIHEKDEQFSVYRRNPRLFTPRDFDYSPYFDIIKFPYLNYDKTFLGLVNQAGGYRDLPWDEDEAFYCDCAEDCFPQEAEVKTANQGEKV
ncbi:MAG: YiiX/YebB-like N1pC/P60 family cysteine hydrolase [Ghiorsea sp.]|nr:YiiX/YebB-like N1pC/P60 family cysteine hydrolase [Ghiorsea sp.]